MAEDLVAMIAREMRAEGKPEYDARWERERRFNLQLARRSHAIHNTDDAAQQRLRWVEGLSDSQISNMSTSIVLGLADDKIQKTLDTLHEKGYPVDGAFSHALDGRETVPGTLRQVLEGRYPAFNDAFNSEFWSRPLAADLTLRDDLEILDPEMREANFGTPTKKPEA